MIAQELLPSSTPYSILDYGVTAIVLIVLGIVLWFTFKTLTRILADHDRSLIDLADSMRIMKEEMFKLVIEARHNNETAHSTRRALELEQAVEQGRREEAASRHRDERDHRLEAARHHLDAVHDRPRDARDH